MSLRWKSYAPNTVLKAVEVQDLADNGAIQVDTIADLDDANMVNANLSYVKDEFKAYRRLSAGVGRAHWIEWTAGGSGFMLRTGYTITHSGGTATLTGGKVTFTGVTSLSLDGVFTADYTDYVVSIQTAISPSASVWRTRLRASGSDATGSDYADQLLNAYGTTVSAARRTAQDNARSGYFAINQLNGYTGVFYGPFLAQPTAGRFVSTSAALGAEIQDEAWTHSLSTAYDGFTIYASYGMTGTLSVYGVRM